MSAICSHGIVILNSLVDDQDGVAHDGIPHATVTTCPVVPIGNLVRNHDALR